MSSNEQKSHIQTLDVEPTRRAELSAAAREFFETSSSVEWETVDLSSPEAVDQLRQENTAASIANGCQQVGDELGVKTEDGVIAGIGVQWVIPPVVGTEDIILHIYGGGFVCGSPEDDLGITCRLAAWTKRRVCAPRYRLSPEHAYPAALQDVTAVYRALVNDSGASPGNPCGPTEGREKLGSTKNRICVVGQSAGGNLALCLAVEELMDDEDRTAAGSHDHHSGFAESTPVLALLSPWIDLTHSGVSQSINQLDPTLSVEHFLKPASLAYCGAKTRIDSPLVSPLLLEQFPKNFPPVYISTGTRDCLYSDGERLARRLSRETRAEVVLDVADKMWHVYEWDPSLPESAKSVRRVCDFLLKHASI